MCIVDRIERLMYIEFVNRNKIIYLIFFIFEAFNQNKFSYSIIHKPMTTTICMLSFIVHDLGRKLHKSIIISIIALIILTNTYIPHYTNVHTTYTVYSPSKILFHQAAVIMMDLLRLFKRVKQSHFFQLLEVSHSPHRQNP